MMKKVRFHYLKSIFVCGVFLGLMACQSFDKGNEGEQKDFEKWVHGSAVEIKNDNNI
jgi:hypothetical protein